MEMCGGWWPEVQGAKLDNPKKVKGAMLLFGMLLVVTWSCGIEASSFRLTKGCQELLLALSPLGL